MLTPKCVTSTPCKANPNPCGIGSCNDEFDGSYTCTCPMVSTPFHFISSLHAVLYLISPWSAYWRPAFAVMSSASHGARGPAHPLLRCFIQSYCFISCHFISSQGSVVGSKTDGSSVCVLATYQSGLPTYTTLARDTCDVSGAASCSLLANTACDRPPPSACLSFSPSISFPSSSPLPLSISTPPPSAPSSLLSLPLSPSLSPLSRNADHCQHFQHLCCPLQVAQPLHQLQRHVLPCR